MTAHGPYATLGELNTALTQFAKYYCHQRPHRALHARTRAEVFAATTAARPAERPLPAASTVRRFRSSPAGIVPAGREFFIGLGAR